MQLNLQILFGSVNADAIILSKPLEQMDSLVDEPIPGFALSVFEAERRGTRPIP